MESGASAILGALGGINMISGAGMLDSLACHSLEKLVIDAEAIASAQRMLDGIHLSSGALAADAFRQTGLSGEFLKLKETRERFREEQHFPSRVIERGSRESVEGGPGQSDSFRRARQTVDELVGSYRPPEISPAEEKKLRAIADRR
jgi:trimethylamine--corrinoid protein Co-methyltransferase